MKGTLSENRKSIIFIEVMASYIGYHGTDAFGAKQIEEYGFQDSSPDCWLGPGIYFFESQPSIDGVEAAEWWVKNFKRYSQWVILETNICPSNVLDLFGSKTDRIKFDKVKQALLKKHLEAGKREIDFDVNVAFLLFTRKVDMIRSLVDGARLDRFTNFVVGYPQIQLCVTKSQCIGTPKRIKEG